MFPALNGHTSDGGGTKARCGKRKDSAIRVSKNNIVRPCSCLKKVHGSMEIVYIFKIGYNTWSGTGLYCGLK